MTSTQKSDLVIVLTYYTPYVSGLTNVARDIAEGLAAIGRRVTVVTSQHDKTLPLEETLNGVEVLRAPVVARMGKGVISPSLIGVARRQSRWSGVVNIHAPMLEAGIVASLSRSPVVLTYHCDVSLPSSPTGRLQEWIIDSSTRLAIRHARVVTVSSDDYADCSRLANAFAGKRVVIPPACHSRTTGRPRFRDGIGPHIGFLGRFVEEKGLEYLVDGFRALSDPTARLLLAGGYVGVAGGSIIGQVRKHIGEDPRIRVLGFLPDDDLNDFYASLDVFALPSVNPLEAFGIVQVEAMMRGIPVIASNLPGVRQPVMKTGMGLIVEPRSAKSVTEALERMRIWKPDVRAGAARATALYGAEAVVGAFAALFQKVAQASR